MIKRKHHYVWRKYLKAWAIDDQIYCKRNGKVFKTNLENVAAEKDFYIINSLSSEDIAMVRKLCIEPMTNAVMKDINSKWVAMFDFVLTFRNSPISKKIPDDLKLQFENKIQNFEEEMQCRFEEMGSPFLDELRNGDTSFYDDEDSNMSFNAFLAMQYFRTKKMQQGVIEATSRFPPLRIDRLWKIMAQIFATTVGATLSSLRNEFKCVLLHNQSIRPFITGDQPVINLHSTYSKKLNEPPVDLELYYPLSPTLALLLTKSQAYETLRRRVVSENDASIYNQKIIEASEEQVYASSASLLNGIE